MNYLLVWVFWLLENLWAYHSLINNSALNIQKKPLLHIVWSPSSLQSIISSITSFWSFQNLSSKPKLLSPSFPESQDEILSKGVVCHIPKFLFWNVNHIPTTNSKFPKTAFILFWNDFILYLNWVYKVKICIGVKFYFFQNNSFVVSRFPNKCILISQYFFKNVYPKL
jgi:hypothetical protein